MQHHHRLGSSKTKILQSNSTSPKKSIIIYVEDQYQDDLNNERFNYFRHISDIIESQGFQIVHAVDHDNSNPKGISQVLREHPEAVAIVTDVDTHKKGAGIEWASQYINEHDHKPFLIISNYPYGALSTENLLKPMPLEAEARALKVNGITILRKPLYEAFPPAKEGDPEPVDEMAKLGKEEEDTFKAGLTGWLKGLKSSLTQGAARVA